MNGADIPMTGYYIILRQGGVQVHSCFSACSFTLSGGQTYQVAAASYGSETFSHWQHTDIETVGVLAASMSIRNHVTYKP